MKMYLNREQGVYDGKQVTFVEHRHLRRPISTFELMNAHLFGDLCGDVVKTTLELDEIHF